MVRATLLATLIALVLAPISKGQDCNCNGRPDDQDIVCGGGNTCAGLNGSYDLNLNGIPDECELSGGVFALLTVGPNGPGSSFSQIQNVIHAGLVQATRSHKSFAEFQSASLSELLNYRVIIAQVPGNLGGSAEMTKIREYVRQGGGFLGETGDENVYPEANLVPGSTTQPVVTDLATSCPLELRARLNTPNPFDFSSLPYPLFWISGYDAAFNGLGVRYDRFLLKGGSRVTAICGGVGTGRIIISGHDLERRGVNDGPVQYNWRLLAAEVNWLAKTSIHDCNANGIADSCDIANHVSSDCDGNGVPDECDRDCNGNGIADACEVAPLCTSGCVADCNLNGVPDSCEVVAGDDCNQNLIPDSCDISTGASLDCNANQVPDSCDIANGASLDCQLNGIPDECEVPPDCNQNGIPDDCEPNQDCNHNGIRDICDIGSGSPDCNFNNAPDACEANPSIQFAAAQNWGGGPSLRWIASGDINLDGYKDLAVAATDADDVRVLLNQQGTGFQAPFSIPVGRAPWFVAIADVSGDGRLDLISADTGSNADPDTISVVIQNPDGTFASRDIYPTGAEPRALSLADFDGDGDIDIVSANNTEFSIRVFRNRGDGKFDPAQTLTVGTRPTGIAAGDWSGDGIPDIAVTLAGTENKVALLRNDGNANFTVIAKYPVGIAPIGVVLDDFDRDHDLDLAVANENTSNVVILINDGTGVFSNAGTYSVGAAPSAIASGDLDGNGLPDLAISNQVGSNVTLLMNAGNGTFVLGNTLVTGFSARAVVIDQLDGAGAPDIAVANRESDSITTFRNLTAAAAGDCDHNGGLDVCQIPQTGVANSRWLPAGPGFWGDAVNWCLPEVPNDNAIASFNVTITGSSAESILDLSPSVASLTLDAHAQVVVGDESGAAVRTLAVAGTIVNSGILRARDRERLLVDAPLIDQSGGGVLESVDGAFNSPVNPDLSTDRSIVEINGARVVGGIARTVGTHSEIHLIGGAELDGVSVQGVIVPDGQSAVFSNTITNRGTILIAPSGVNLAVLAPSDAGGTLTGNGGGDDALVLGGQTVANLGSFESNFTNAASHRLEGTGVIFGGMTNDGVVRANVPGKRINLFPPGDKTNTAGAVMQASVGGVLRLADSVTNAGTIQATGQATATQPSTVLIEDTQRNDGIIRADLGGIVNINAAITGGGRLVANDSGTINVRANITDDTPASDSGFSTQGGNITVGFSAIRLIVLEDGPGTVDPPAPPAAGASAVSISNATLQGNSLWRIGDGLAFAGRTAKLELLNNGIGIVNGSVHLLSNGSLRILGSSLSATNFVLEPGATLEVAGSLTLSGSLSVAGLDGSSTRWSISPSTVVTMKGGIFATTQPGTLEGWATFEAGSQDLGSAGGVSDFSFGPIALDVGAHVSLVDCADNHPGDPEAVYCESLSLASGSVLNLNGIRLFVRAGQQYAPVVVDPQQCPCAYGAGTIVDETRVPVLGDVNCDGSVDSGDLPAFLGVLLGSDTIPMHVAGADVNGDGATDGLDVQSFVNQIIR